MLLPCLKRHRSAIFREADEVEMVVMIGKNRFGLVAEIHEELKVSGGAQHGAGVKFVGIGGRTFNLADEGLPHSLTLMSRTHREQSDHADAGHRPEAHGANDCFSLLRHKYMFLSGVFFQTVESFCGPAAYFIEAGIFPERGLLHVEESGKI